MKFFTIHMATKENVIPLTRLLSCHVHLCIHFPQTKHQICKFLVYFFPKKGFCQYFCAIHLQVQKIYEERRVVFNLNDNFFDFQIFENIIV